MYAFFYGLATIDVADHSTPSGSFWFLFGFFAFNFGWLNIPLDLAWTFYPHSTHTPSQYMHSSHNLSTCPGKWTTFHVMAPWTMSLTIICILLYWMIIEVSAMYCCIDVFALSLMILNLIIEAYLWYAVCRIVTIFAVSIAIPWTPSKPQTLSLHTSLQQT